MSRFPAHRTTPWLMNSDPLSKSMPSTGNGIASTAASRAEMMCFSALLRIERVKVHPVSTSVMFTVRANSPLSTGPQWATVSTSKNPGSASTSSPALRILMELRSRGPAFVVDRPRTARTLTGAR